MITLKEYLELIEYKINEGSDYGWLCYGSDTHMISAWNGIHGTGGFSFNCVFDTKDQTVYEVEVCDYTNDRAYRMINPDFKSAYDAEADDRGIGTNEAWDGVDYVDLESTDDFIQKALAIRAGEDYDTNISVPLDFTDEELLKYMVMAHERNITFNQFVTEALQAAIEEHKRDPEGMKAKADQWEDNCDVT